MATSTVNKVVTGFDAKIMLRGKQIGRSQEFTASIKQNIETIYEQGTRKPVELKEKKFEVSGTLSRLYIDQDLIKEVLGGGLSFAETTPYVDIVGYVKNPADGSIKTVTFQNAKFGDIELTVPLEANATEKVNFTALGVLIA